MKTKQEIKITLIHNGKKTMRVDIDTTPEIVMDEKDWNKLTDMQKLFAQRGSEIASAVVEIMGMKMGGIK